MKLVPRSLAALLALPSADSKFLTIEVLGTTCPPPSPGSAAVLKRMAPASRRLIPALPVSVMPRRPKRIRVSRATSALTSPEISRGFIVERRGTLVILGPFRICSIRFGPIISRNLSAINLAAAAAASICSFRRAAFSAAAAAASSATRKASASRSAIAAASATSSIPPLTWWKMPLSIISSLRASWAWRVKLCFNAPLALSAASWNRLTVSISPCCLVLKSSMDNAPTSPKRTRASDASLAPSIKYENKKPPGRPNASTAFWKLPSLTVNVVIPIANAAKPKAIGPPTAITGKSPVPNPEATILAVVANLPKTNSKGATATAIAAKEIPISMVSGESSDILSARFVSRFSSTLTSGNNCWPISIPRADTLALNWLNMDAVVSCTLAKPSSTRPALSLILSRILANSWPWLPAVPSTPLRARMFGITNRSCSTLSPKASTISWRAAGSPSVWATCRNCSKLSPASASALVPSSVLPVRSTRVLRRDVTASSALTPKRVKVARKAPTLAKLIPRLAATPMTRPSVPARLSASRLPSRTVAIIISVAWAALRFSLP